MRRHCGHAALTAVMAAMHAYPDDARLQAGCCAALMAAAEYCAENAVSAGAAGAVEAVVKALRR
jgi:hypothetical protein